MMLGRFLDLQRLAARRHAGALLLHHHRFAAAMAEALPDRRGLRPLQRQRLAARRAPGSRARTAFIRLAHAILSLPTNNKRAHRHQPALLSSPPEKPAQTQE